MNKQIYLTTEITKLLAPAKFPKFWLQYNLLRLKRRLPQTIVIFMLQFMIIINLPFPCPALAMCPPIGMAFIMFYFLGGSALLGLFLSGFCGYLLMELPPASFFFYLFADIAGGYLGARLCQNIFAADIKIFSCWPQVIKFIMTNAFAMSLPTSLLRIFALVIDNKINITGKTIFYTWLNLWLADLNAILILTGFLLSWVYVPFSREKISRKKITKSMLILLLGFIVLSWLFMQNIALIYLLAAAMLTSVYLALAYGHLIATLLLFINSGIYLSYFIAIQGENPFYLQGVLMLVPPSVLLLFTLVIFYIGHYTLRESNN